MEPLKKHKLLLYGRIAVSVVLYIVFIVIGTSAALAAQLQSEVILLSVLLILAVILLPRRTVPPDGRAKQMATKEEIEKLVKVRSWLTWTRLIFLLVAIGVFVFLPSLVQPGG